MAILTRVRHELGMMKYRIRCQMWDRIKTKTDELQLNTKQGKFFISTRDNGIGGPLYTARQFDLREMKLVTDFLRRERLLEAPAETLMLDVGANIGVICIGMLNKGMAGKAIAIEAARLRSRHPISLPDAYCLATAKHTRSSLASFDHKVIRAAASEDLRTAEGSLRTDEYP